MIELYYSCSLHKILGSGMKSDIRQIFLFFCLHWSCPWILYNNSYILTSAASRNCTLPRPELGAYVISCASKLWYVCSCSISIHTRIAWQRLVWAACAQVQQTDASEAWPWMNVISGKNNGRPWGSWNQSRVDADRVNSRSKLTSLSEPSGFRAGHVEYPDQSQLANFAKDPLTLTRTESMKVKDFGASIFELLPETSLTGAWPRGSAARGIRRIISFRLFSTEQCNQRLKWPLE